MNLEQARFNMVEQQIRPWEVLDPTVLDVMRRVPRDRFVAQPQVRLAYADIEIPLGHGEKMMHPRVEGRMLQALDIAIDDSCLEIGTGSGFVTACLAHLGRDVYSVDMHEDFIDQAVRRLQDQHIVNANLHVKNAFTDLDPVKQFDVIAVTGAVATLASSVYFEQFLKPGGRLFIVVGVAPVMHAMLITRTGENDFSRISLFETQLGYLQGIEEPKVFSL